MKGRLAEPRPVICRNCGREFMSNCIGKAAWYCDNDECAADRARKYKKSHTEQQAQSYRKNKQRQVGELERLDALSRQIVPSSAEFKRAVRAIVSAPDGARKHELYFRLSALALAAYRLTRPRT